MKMSLTGGHPLFTKLRNARPFALIAGLNVIESYDSMVRVAESLASVTSRLGIEFAFKASFDKANRSNEGAFRGPGVEKGLEYLAKLKREFDIPMVTDVHEATQCTMVHQAGLDMIQIPAFLCRQTDLIHAAADTGLPLLLKKGQFASVDVMKAAETKARSRKSCGGVILCERGTSVGAEQLIVDIRNLVQMRSPTALVALDATHAAQRPALRTREGKGSDGDLYAVQALARAGVAVGIDCLFMEVHPDPDSAPVDSKIQWPLDRFGTFLEELVAIAGASQWRESLCPLDSRNDNSIREY